MRGDASLKGRSSYSPKILQHFSFAHKELGRICEYFLLLRKSCNFGRMTAEKRFNLLIYKVFSGILL